MRLLKAANWPCAATRSRAVAPGLCQQLISMLPSLLRHQQSDLLVALQTQFETTSQSQLGIPQDQRAH